MKVYEMPEKELYYNLVIRTNNQNERSPDTRKIPSLWEQLFKLHPELAQQEIFGVYSNYDSNENGDYNYFICTEHHHEPSQKFNIKPGKYLVFLVQGPIPHSVISSWDQIWEFFADPDCAFERNFEADYELYKNHEEVQIYIGIK